MEKVIVLAHSDMVRVDPAAMKALTEQMGEAGAEGIVCRAMEELANRLSLIERCYHQKDWDALWKSVKGVIGIAEQVGLLDLAQVARDVADCAKGDDGPALSATFARLIRMGDRSLTAVWDTPQLSV